MLTSPYSISLFLTVRTGTVAEWILRRFQKLFGVSISWDTERPLFSFSLFDTVYRDKYRDNNLANLTLPSPSTSFPVHYELVILPLGSL